MSMKSIWLPSTIESQKTAVVSPKEFSDEGIQLIGVAGGQGLKEVTATVSFVGEEVGLKYRLEGLYPGSRGPEGSLINKKEDDRNRERRGLPNGGLGEIPKTQCRE